MKKETKKIYNTLWKHIKKSKLDTEDKHFLAYEEKYDDDIKTPIFTSLKLSKKLWKNNCRLSTEYVWRNEKHIGYVLRNDVIPYEEYNDYPAYDSLWDICIRYRKEFFSRSNNSNHMFTTEIFNMILQNKSQEEIEKYIWKMCNFNPKNTRI